MSYTYSRRVEFGDTDLAGIMHFSNFFRFMEAAETDFLRSLGLSVSWIDQAGTKRGFPRVSATCDYKSPAKFEDVIEIDVFVEQVGKKSVSYRFEFRKEKTQIAVGKITAVYVQVPPGGTMTAATIPDEIRQTLDSKLEKK